jgi:hypothetical protein
MGKTNVTARPITMLRSSGVRKCSAIQPYSVRTISTMEPKTNRHELTIRMGPTALEQKRRKKATILVANAGGQI